MTGQTSDVAPHNSLKHHNFRPLDEHSPSTKLILILLHLLRHLVDIRRDDVVRNNILQFIEPESRNFGEEFAFVRNTLNQ